MRTPFGREDFEVVGEPESLGGDHQVGPPAHLGLGGGDREIAVGPEPGVDVVFFAEGPDRLDARLARAAEPERRGVAEHVGEVRQLVPVAVDEAAVASARAAAADVLFQHDDVDPGIELLELDRRPQPGVATTQDHDVGGGVASQPRRGIACELRHGERLPEPPAAALVGRHERCGRIDGGAHRVAKRIAQRRSCVHGARARSGVTTAHASTRSRRRVAAGCYGEVSTLHAKGSQIGRRTSAQLGGHRRAEARACSRDAARRRLR